MARRCGNCIHKNVCELYDIVQDPTHAVGCGNFLDTADVVPKSEIEELKAIIADHKASEERWEELYSNTKTEVARKIIKDLVKFADDKERQMSFHGDSVWYIDADDVTDFIAELKKKYTEGK
jgi:transcription initiation factor IIE alpha subunit